MVWETRELSQHQIHIYRAVKLDNSRQYIDFEVSHQKRQVTGASPPTALHLIPPSAPLYLAYGRNSSGRETTFPLVSRPL
jgi:hypothetical protein